jgi:hypothetical protein
MLKSRSVLPFLVLALAGLGGCNSVKSSLGLTKEGPDEFAVVAKQPLIIPPDYTLRPPEPGAPSPQDVQPAAAASTAIFGPNIVGTTEAGTPPPVGMGGTQAPSAGELALLNSAKAQDADPQIRSLVNRETAEIAEKSQSFTDEIIFWRDPESPDVVLDASKEAQRLRENAAAGLPPNSGDVPQIKRGKRALLEGIF